MSKPTLLQRTIPNSLTALRLLATPLTVGLLLSDHYSSAFIVFSLAAITDYIDGYLARQWKVESKFGRIFDPIADKALMISIVITLAYSQHIPEILAVLIVGRDGLIIAGGLLVYFLQLPVRLAPSRSSKINTFFQLAFIGLILLLGQSYQDIIALDNFWLAALTVTLMSLTILTTLWSGVEYIIYFVRQNFRTRPRG